MARRATVLEGYRREPVPTLTLVGADEFSPDTELPDPAKTGDASPEAVRAVYDALHVDCGMLSAGAAAWFGASRPRNFFEVGDTPVTKRFHVGGVPVAVILFPPLSAGKGPSLLHISPPPRPDQNSDSLFCFEKKKKNTSKLR